MISQIIKKIQEIMFQTRNRSITISKEMIGYFKKVHNGRRYAVVTVANTEMIGHKIYIKKK